MRSPFPFAALILIPIATLGSCSGPPVVIPPPAQPIPVPAPTPSPTPVVVAPAAPAADWRDWPVSDGGWVYRQDDRGSIALFGRAGQDAELTLRCDRGRQRIYLSRKGEGGGALTIRTTSTLRQLSASPAGGTPAYMAVELAPRDTILDAMAFSRGKFVIETAGQPGLVVPAWAELTRVVEDCR